MSAIHQRIMSESPLAATGDRLNTSRPAFLAKSSGATKTSTSHTPATAPSTDRNPSEIRNVTPKSPAQDANVRTASAASDPKNLELYLRSLASLATALRAGVDIRDRPAVISLAGVVSSSPTAATSAPARGTVRIIANCLRGNDAVAWLRRYARTLVQRDTHNSPRSPTGAGDSGPRSTAATDKSAMQHASNLGTALLRSRFLHCVTPGDAAIPKHLASTTVYEPGRSNVIQPGDLAILDHPSALYRFHVDEGDGGHFNLPEALIPHAAYVAVPISSSNHVTSVRLKGALLHSSSMAKQTHTLHLDPSVAAVLFANPLAALRFHAHVAANSALLSLALVDRLHSMAQKLQVCTQAEARILQYCRSLARSKLQDMENDDNHKQHRSQQQKGWKQQTVNDKRLVAAAASVLLAGGAHTGSLAADMHEVTSAVDTLSSELGKRWKSVIDENRRLQRHAARALLKVADRGSRMCASVDGPLSANVAVPHSNAAQHKSKHHRSNAAAGDVANSKSPGHWHHWQSAPAIPAAQKRPAGSISGGVRLAPATPARMMRQQLSTIKESARESTDADTDGRSSSAHGSGSVADSDRPLRLASKAHLLHPEDDDSDGDGQSVIEEVSQPFPRFSSDTLPSDVASAAVSQTMSSQGVTEMPQQQQQQHAPASNRLPSPNVLDIHVSRWLWDSSGTTTTTASIGADGSGGVHATVPIAIDASDPHLHPVYRSTTIVPVHPGAVLRRLLDHTARSSWDPGAHQIQLLQHVQLPFAEAISSRSARKTKLPEPNSDAERNSSDERQSPGNISSSDAQPTGTSATTAGGAGGISGSLTSPLNIIDDYFHAPSSVDMQSPATSAGARGALGGAALPSRSPHVRLSIVPGSAEDESMDAIPGDGKQQSAELLQKPTAKVLRRVCAPLASSVASRDVTVLQVASRLEHTHAPGTSMTRRKTGSRLKQSPVEPGEADSYVVAEVSVRHAGCPSSRAHVRAECLSEVYRLSPTWVPASQLSSVIGTTVIQPSTIEQLRQLQQQHVSMRPNANAARVLGSDADDNADSGAGSGALSANNYRPGYILCTVVERVVQWDWRGHGAAAPGTGYAAAAATTASSAVLHVEAEIADLAKTVKAKLFGQRPPPPANAASSVAAPKPTTGGGSTAIVGPSGAIPPHLASRALHRIVVAPLQRLHAVAWRSFKMEQRQHTLVLRQFQREHGLAFGYGILPIGRIPPPAVPVAQQVQSARRRVGAAQPSQHSPARENADITRGSYPSAAPGSVSSSSLPGSRAGGNGSYTGTRSTASWRPRVSSYSSYSYAKRRASIGSVATATTALTVASEVSTVSGRSMGVDGVASLRGVDLSVNGNGPLGIEAARPAAQSSASVFSSVSQPANRRESQRDHLIAGTSPNDSHVTESDLATSDSSPVLHAATAAGAGAPSARLDESDGADDTLRILDVPEDDGDVHDAAGADGDAGEEVHEAGVAVEAPVDASASPAADTSVQDLVGIPHHRPLQSATVTPTGQPNPIATGRRRMRIGLADFKPLAVLGKGGYGTVLAVQRINRTSTAASSDVRPRQSPPDEGHIYAMKILSKTVLRNSAGIVVPATAAAGANPPAAAAGVGDGAAAAAAPATPGHVATLNKRALTERNILSKARGHPFLVGLKYAFQTKNRLHLVTEFCPGGDLYTHLSRFGPIVSLPRLVQTAAELVLALSHLHDSGVIYRDLKPENVLMDGEGHVKITDFGLSRFDPPPVVKAAVASALALESDDPDARHDDNQMQKEADTGEAAGGDSQSAQPPAQPAAPAKQRAPSFCGTEQYMSPETLLQATGAAQAQPNGAPIQGPQPSADWWSLGILLAEAATGMHPFRGHSHLQTLRNIVSPRVPPAGLQVLPPVVASFIGGLLCKDPSQRLGSVTAGGINALLSHPFFSLPIGYPLSEGGAIGVPLHPSQILLLQQRAAAKGLAASRAPLPAQPHPLVATHGYHPSLSPWYTHWVALDWDRVRARGYAPLYTPPLQSIARQHQNAGKPAAASTVDLTHFESVFTCESVANYWDAALPNGLASETTLLVADDGTAPTSSVTDGYRDGAFRSVATSFSAFSYAAPSVAVGRHGFGRSSVGGMSFDGGMPSRMDPMLRYEPDTAGDEADARPGKHDESGSADEREDDAEDKNGQDSEGSDGEASDDDGDDDGASEASGGEGSDESEYYDYGSDVEYEVVTQGGAGAAAAADDADDDDLDANPTPQHAAGAATEGAATRASSISPRSAGAEVGDIDYEADAVVVAAGDIGGPSGDADDDAADEEDDEGDASNGDYGDDDNCSMVRPIDDDGREDDDDVYDQESGDIGSSLPPVDGYDGQATHYFNTAVAGASQSDLQGAGALSAPNSGLRIQATRSGASLHTSASAIGESRASAGYRHEAGGFGYPVARPTHISTSYQSNSSSTYASSGSSSSSSPRPGPLATTIGAAASLPFALGSGSPAMHGVGSAPGIAFINRTSAPVTPSAGTGGFDAATGGLSWPVTPSAGAGGYAAATGGLSWQNTQLQQQNQRGLGAPAPWVPPHLPPLRPSPLDPLPQAFAFNSTSRPAGAHTQHAHTGLQATNSTPGTAASTPAASSGAAALPWALSASPSPATFAAGSYGTGGYAFHSNFGTPAGPSPVNLNQNINAAAAAGRVNGAWPASASPGWGSSSSSSVPTPVNAANPAAAAAGNIPVGLTLGRPQAAHLPTSATTTPLGSTPTSGGFNLPWTTKNG